IHEDPIALDKFLELGEGLREFLQELVKFRPGGVIEIAFKPADAPDVGCQSSTADFFVYLIDQLAILEHINKAGQCTCIDADHGVADNVVGNARQFHDDDAEIIHALGNFSADEFLYRHVPSDVVDRSRTVVETIGDGRDLIKRSPFGELLVGPVDIAARFLVSDVYSAI